MFEMTMVQEISAIFGFIVSGLAIGFSIIFPCATQLALKRALMAGS